MAFPVGEELTQAAEPTSLHLNGDIDGSQFLPEDLDVAESRSYRRKAYIKLLWDSREPYRTIELGLES